MSQSGILHVGGSGGPSIDTINGVGPVVTTGNLTLAGSGPITITNSIPTNTITIGLSGGGVVWKTLTAAGPEAGAINTGYIANFAGIAEITLPSGAGSAPVGSIMEVIQLDTSAAAGFRLLCPVGVTIYDGTTTATSSLTYSNVVPFVGPPIISDRFGSVRIVCVVADTVWIVVNERGSTFVAV